MDLILLIIFTLLGLIIGSFLNVVLYRFNTEKSLGGRSACMSCQSKLHWYDLIPVFSFFLLSGRCRMCKTKISTQYPLVELTTGFIFGILFWKFQELFFVNILVFSFVYSYFVTIFCLLLLIMVYDIKHKIIPDTLSFVFGVFVFIGLFFFYPSSVDSHIPYVFHLPAISDFLAGFVISVPFALLWFVSRGTWMGLGDAKLAVGMGFLLGMSGVISATIIAFWIGAIVGLLLIAFKRLHGIKDEIPFAPFLILGTSLVFMFGFELPLFF